MMNRLEQFVNGNEPAPGNSEELRHLLFNIYTEEFGIDLSSVREVTKYVKPLPIPDMPKYVAGLLNMRGDVIPVFDMRAIFGLTVINFDDLTSIIITEWEEKVFGLIVDGIVDLANVTENKKFALLDGLASDNHFIKNMADLRMRQVPLIDLEALLRFVKQQERPH